MDKLLACDWGTSKFRLKLIDIASADVLAQEVTDEGIATIYGQWQNEATIARKNFYLDYINHQIETLEAAAGFTLAKMPLVISGMASSSIGLAELAYKKLPFAIDGSDLVTERFVDEKTGREIILISGVSSHNDVMRGEETLIIGATAEANIDEDQIFILPGTHSKHIELRGKKAVAFRSFMTGELFDLLANKSILAHSVKKGDPFPAPALIKSFEAAVAEAATNNLLNSIFHVRTNELFKKNSPEENYYYLSGLLIAAELKDLRTINKAITLVGNESLMSLYKAALHILFPERILTLIAADRALIKGQLKIYQTLKTYYA